VFKVDTGWYSAVQSDGRTHSLQHTCEISATRSYVALCTASTLRNSA
jgi:hypothetical protein